MAFQPSGDSFGIRRLGFNCSWWHPRQANDAIASHTRDNYSNPGCEIARRGLIMKDEEVQRFFAYYISGFYAT